MFLYLVTLDFKRKLAALFRSVILLRYINASWKIEEALLIIVKILYYLHDFHFSFQGFFFSLLRWQHFSLNLLVY